VAETGGGATPSEPPLAGTEAERLLGALERSRARFASFLREHDLAAPVATTTPAGEHASARRLVCDLVEEHGRPTGHADLPREAVDGRVGEDPPPGWRPGAG